MKKLLVLIVLIAGGWFGYQRWQGDADVIEQIENPMFAEIRVQQKIAGRDFEMALFGRMVDETDCRERARHVWEKVIEGCAGCSMTVSDCRAELPARYARLFDNVQIHSTYLAFTRGGREERDGRMVMWGVTAAEGNAICENARTAFQRSYKGSIECVAARPD